MPYFCGLDWGSVGHAVCVVDETGAVLLHFEVAHDAAGLAELRRKLDRLAPAGDIPIAIERPSGLIVDTLVEAGHPVVPIHPNVVKACRPRYRAAGGKSDPGDAYMLADILRTDGHRFRPLAPCSRRDQGVARPGPRSRRPGRRAVALANQLRSLLDSFWPGAAAIFADVDSPIALAFLAALPDARERQRASARSAWRPSWRSNAYCGRRSAGRAARAAARRPDRLGRRGRSRGQGRAGPRSRRASSSAWSPRSPSSPAASSTPSQSCPTARSSCPSHAPGASAPRRSSPSSATCANASRPTTTSPPRPASPRHPRLRQEPRRRLPLGMQPSPARSRHLLRRQLPTRIPLGRRHLQARPQPRLRSSPRHPHPRPRLDTRPLARLERWHPLRPKAA